MLRFYVQQLIDAISRVFFSLRLRLLLLVLLACAPLVGLTLHSASKERRRAVTAWRERARQLAEETLQTRDEMIRELPLLPAAVCVCDQFGAVELYNRTAVELWGASHPTVRQADASAVRS